MSDYKSELGTSQKFSALNDWRVSCIFTSQFRLWAKFPILVDFYLHIDI